MFGDKFLVAPKAETPTANVLKFHAPVDVSVYLPVGVNWYFYWSGQPVAGQATMQTVPIA
jgi:alpha-glucosidase (family GH31 glycosyl hydrolase)